MNSFQKHCLMTVITLVGLFTANSVNTVSAQQRSLAKPMASTFRIRAQSKHGNVLTTGHGTAFGVNLVDYGYGRPRYLMTACHVIVERNGSVSPLLQLEIKQNGRVRWARLRVIAKDAKMDVALLECETDLPGTTKFAVQDTVKGSPIVTIGSPGGVPLKAFKGRVTANKRADASVAYVEYIQEGCSGGPVFDSGTQRVTGLVIAGIGVGAAHKMDPHTCLYVSLYNMKRFVRGSLRSKGDGYANRRNPPTYVSQDSYPNGFTPNGNDGVDYPPLRRNSYPSCPNGDYPKSIDRSGAWLP